MAEVDEELAFIQIWERVSETLDARQSVPERDVRELALYAREIYERLMAARGESRKLTAEVSHYRNGQGELALG